MSSEQQIQRSREDFAPYARQLAVRLGLRDWRIEIGDVPPPNSDSSEASTWTAYGQRRAEIYLSDRFLGASPEDQRDTVVHELLHLHFAAMDGLVTDWLEAVHQKSYSRMFEYVIEAVAVAIASLFPLPSEVLDRGDATETPETA